MYAKIVVIGRLGRDPEIKKINDGTSVANFSVAFTKTWRDKNGEKKEKVVWFEVVAWRGLADTAAKYLKKGHRCFVEGEPLIENYKNKDGEEKTAFKINAIDIKFLENDRKVEGSKIDPSASNPYADVKNVEVKENFDNLPF